MARCDDANSRDLRLVRGMADGRDTYGRRNHSYGAKVHPFPREDEPGTCGRPRFPIARLYALGAPNQKAPSQNTSGINLRASGESHYCKATLPKLLRERATVKPARPIGDMIYMHPGNPTLDWVLQQPDSTVTPSQPTCMPLPLHVYSPDTSRDGHM
jgi:hypothetical protein